MVVVCGLVSEAKLVDAAECEAICSGGDSVALERRLRARIAQGCTGLLSFGIAGGLAPVASTGTIVVADAVVDGLMRFSTDRLWSDRLRRAMPEALTGKVHGSDAAIDSPARKQRLHEATGALAVDMESHVVARLAVEHHIPFAVLRVVSDPADRVLPPAALVGMRPDGRADIAAVLKSLARNTRQLPSLIATAREVSQAMKRLRAAAQWPAIGPAVVSPAIAAQSLQQEQIRIQGSVQGLPAALDAVVRPIMIDVSQTAERAR